MGEKDLAEKTLEAYNDVFADIVNVLLFNGKKLIKEDELEQETVNSVYKADGKLHGLERDVAKFWNKNNVRIALLGLENQTDVDKDMPIRIMAYDGAAYRQQLLNTYEADPETGKQTKKKNANPIYPVVTLVLYFGEKPWNQYKTLFESFDVMPELKPFLNDYRINVFEIAWLTDEQVNMFQSDFKIVADYFVQMRKNKNYVPSKQTINHVYEILQLMDVFTQDNRFVEYQNLYVKGEKINMCEYLDRIISNGRNEGWNEGRINAFYDMIKKGRLTVKEAAEDIGVPISELLDKFKQYNLVL